MFCNVANANQPASIAASLQQLYPLERNTGKERNNSYLIRPLCKPSPPCQHRHYNYLPVLSLSYSFSCECGVLATLPPFGPIEGQKKWFDQISSQWESQKNRTGLQWSISAKSSFFFPAFEISRSCRTASWVQHNVVADQWLHSSAFFFLLSSE
jgi:hypothetical protein